MDTPQIKLWDKEGNEVFVTTNMDAREYVASGYYTTTNPSGEQETKIPPSSRPDGKSPLPKRKVQSAKIGEVKKQPQKKEATQEQINKSSPRGRK